ncbi:hypothetical protein PCANC_08104 [Puccinia coronata f. sp. avenae]|uniref:Store-operated calcium entry-associated regulatory factor n=1 Tax=Puccinia coronata f. sp. avenae TaxID=200324 RepID=A0A2N5V3H4_9BASI|nr:hypothetical protein PCASD_22375 [Puccinia coronata f. sp. avenae]PLW44558.1 hypothetical protein PCANC_08104 [Puccinia coronata f. sp. avenae]
MASQKVLLSSIDTLTFYDGETTTFRRTSPVQQLSCSGPGCKLFRPDVIQCYNKGGSGTEIDWKCEADLPSKLRLGRVEVGCEGWSNSNDPYILKGSCALSYTLKADSSSSHGSSHDGKSTDTTASFWILFIVVAIVILYPVLRLLLLHFFPSLDSFLPAPSGGGGGGGGGPADPPPPYTPQQPPYKSAPSSSEPWRPGFWTGVATGSGASALFRSSQNRRNQPREHNCNSPHGGPSTGFGSGATYRGQGSSRDMDDNSNLGRIRTSTGFGGTQNR